MNDVAASELHKLRELSEDNGDVTIVLRQLAQFVQFYTTLKDFDGGAFSYSEPLTHCVTA